MSGRPAELDLNLVLPGVHGTVGPRGSCYFSYRALGRVLPIPTSPPRPLYGRNLTLTLLRHHIHFFCCYHHKQQHCCLPCQLKWILTGVSFLLQLTCQILLCESDGKSQSCYHIPGPSRKRGWEFSFLHSTLWKQDS